MRGGESFVESPRNQIRELNWIPVGGKEKVFSCLTSEGEQTRCVSKGREVFECFFFF